MLRMLHMLRGYKLLARDGEIGACKDFLFDDEAWVVRYMVADTHRWLPGRQVLIVPEFLDTPEWETEFVPVRLTREQIEASPPLDADAPISRRYEQAYHEYFSLPYYWLGGDLLAGRPDAGGVVNPVNEPMEGKGESEVGDEVARLRSVHELKGYRIDTTDEEFGEVEEFLVDDETWRIDYVVISTSRWLPGRRLLIGPEHVESIDWADQSIQLNLKAKALRDVREFDPDLVINRRREEILYDFKGRPRGHSG